MNTNEGGSEERFDDWFDVFRKTKPYPNNSDCFSHEELMKEAWEAQEQYWQKKYQELEGKVDSLLGHCEKENGECSGCARIICPYNDELHFHHDGCPSCEQDHDQLKGGNKV
jgi:hypothetical protein